SLTFDDPAIHQIAGKWETTFGIETNKPYKSLGVFEQTGTKLTGTFLTETGDYRYLTGYTEHDKVVLSTFDGAFAFLFIAIYDGTQLRGKFYSGNHWKTEWIAERNEAFELKD